MHRNNINRRGAASARGFMALFAIVLAMGLASMASPAEAAPFAYVTNAFDNTVSVIDTATNMVVATVGVGTQPFGVAVTPDGKHAYVANYLSNNVSVIDTATNTVVATAGVGTSPGGVAVTPDGKHAYVTNFNQAVHAGTVSVIDTATNTVSATVVVGNNPTGIAVTPGGKNAYVANFNFSGSASVSVIDTATNTVVGSPIGLGNGAQGVAVTPDGKHVYVANQESGPGAVSVIDTATNTVVATVPVQTSPEGVAVTPDGTHVYAANESGSVSVIDTATNTVVATVGVGSQPIGVALTPDGKHAYVANAGGGVSVIDTATNTAEPTVVTVGKGPYSVAIGPPPACIPFLAFSAKLELDLEHKPNKDHFELLSSFTLGSASNGIKPATEPVTLKIGTFTTTILPGSFKDIGLGIFVFHGVIGGVRLEALIAPTGSLRYALVAAAQDANLTGTVNPVPVTLTIGDDCGTTSVKADIDR